MHHELSDNDFEQLIARAIDELPEKYTENLNNVAITYADMPDADQREKLRLNNHETLLGLYEGIPLTKRGGNYSMVLPDKITLFKLPILASTRDEKGLFDQIKHTLWHEIAHFYGLDHDRIDALDRKRAQGA